MFHVFVIAVVLVAGALASGAPSVSEKRARDFMDVVEAARGGNRQRVEELIERGAPVLHPPEGGDTDAEYFSHTVDPVQAAAEGGFSDILSLLLSAGADPDWQCCSGETALFFAAKRGHTEAVRVLISAGASPIRMGDGGPPLLAALTNQHFETARVLLLPTLLTVPGGVLAAFLAVGGACMWRMIRSCSRTR